MRPALSFVTAMLAVAAAGKNVVRLECPAPSVARTAVEGAPAAAIAPTSAPRLVEARSASSFLAGFAGDNAGSAHNLTTILASGAMAFAHGRREHALRYAILGERRSVHDALVQTSDGKLALVLWRDGLSGEQVTVELAATAGSATLYDTAVGATPTATLGNVSSVTLTLADAPQVVAL